MGHKEPFGRFGEKVGHLAAPDARDEGKEGSGDPEGQESKCRLALSGRRHDRSDEKVFLLIFVSLFWTVITSYY